MADYLIIYFFFFLKAICTRKLFWQPQFSTTIARTWLAADSLHKWRGAILVGNRFPHRITHFPLPFPTSYPPFPTSLIPLLPLKQLHFLNQVPCTGKFVYYKKYIAYIYHYIPANRSVVIDIAHGSFPYPVEV